MFTLDTDKRYTVEGYAGVVFYLDENRGEGEWVQDITSDTVIAVMVGDDREHEVSIDDLTEISDDDYCSDCGQIGCGW